MPDRKHISGAKEVAMIKSRIEMEMGRQRPLIVRQAAFARDQISKISQARESDRLRLAENLFQIIDLACRADGKRVTRANIVAEAGMADQNGKSSRLYDYAIDPAISEGERCWRAKKRLIKKPVGYLRLAEAAAKLGGLDVDQVVVDLVQGTRLAEGMSDLPDTVEPEHLVMLAAAIQGEAKRIAEATCLDWYFNTIDQQGLAPNGSEWEADHQAFLWTHRTVPWVDLFTEEVAVFRGIWWPKNDDGTFGEKMVKAVWVCRRIGLALAPFGPGKTVRAFFVRRPVLVIKDFPARRDKHDPFSFEDMVIEDPLVTSMPDPEGRIYHRSGTLQVTTDARQVALCPAGTFDEEDHDFIEVTPSSIGTVLETGLSTSMWMSTDAFYVPVAAYTKSPPGSRASDLERVLLHGREFGDGDTRLMATLEAQAANCVHGLRAWVDARVTEIEEVMTRMASHSTREAS
ncbi:MAG: hypothetical protein FD119_116 [Stygiobacter sp.]|nr:MAG: hypothetical protein FD119_116 [Stygiobacter sp.]